MFRHASRNRAYSLVWNEKQCAYVPAPEGSRARRKRSGGVAVAALLAAGNAFALDPGAHPTGGAVVGGAATISQAGPVTSIAQATQRAVIHWQSFDIGSQSVVNFVQPNSSSVVMNQVLTQNPTQIAGTLNANGQVFVVNPGGVLFAPGAQVSAAGVLASTRTVSTDDFMAGRLVFSGNSSGTVINRGGISAAQGGYVVLVGAQVVNEGSISAPGGDVRLAAADQVTLKVDGTGLSMFQVDRGTLDALVVNQGAIKADGGRIYLTADALDALSKATVNNTGLIEALSVDNRHGVVELLGDTRVGQVEVGGRIDVSSTTGGGGKVAVSAHDVALHDGASIDASGALGGGKVLVGGGWQGQDATIANASTVTMAPNARIDVNARDVGDGGTAVLWSQDQTRFAGAIAARGGAAAGQGGRVETSSHDNLQALGSVDAAAPAGAAGVWLLDPRNVIIAASGASGTAFSGSGSYGATATYTPTADSVILASTIVNTLNAGANVIVTTGSTGASAGNITVNAPIAMTGPYSVTTALSLLAANDINVNALISNSPGVFYNKLNVVLTPGSAGNVNFSSAGRVVTGGGNLYVGTVSGAGQAEAVARTGQNFTMAAGSSIDAGGGMIDVQVNGAITIAASSLLNTNGSALYNNGAQSLTGSLVRLNGAGITSSNSSATTPDIVTTTTTTLQADAIGSSVNPIKISAGSGEPGSARLNVNNSVGNSYVNEITNQAFNTVAVSIGSQEASTQDIRILGDFGGDGHSGVGHILLNTDDGGVLNIAAGDIRTAGSVASLKTNVEVSATTMTFADSSVNTGAAYFSASGTNLVGVAPANNVPDIAAPDVRLSGIMLGTQVNPVELSSGTTSSGGTLTVTNSGGSTFLKSVDNNFTTINLNHVKGIGTHAILFAGGDHFDYGTDGSNVVLPTISGGASDGNTFFATTGMDGSRRNRSVVVTPLTGGAVFGDTSVNLGSGSFALVIPRANATGTVAAANAYNVEAPVAQITAGNVSFSVQNDLTPSVTTIGAGGKDIQIAQGTGAANNTLSVATQQGSVALHELTPNHFKTITLSLGSASAVQPIAIDLAGPDDINFSDSGSLVTVDATKVNVSSNNRNFSLTTDLRSIQTDGNSLGTGYYTLRAGNLLRLNGDVSTDGGAITLFGFNGVDLLRTVLVDSNVGHSGNGGGISVGANTSSPTATVSSTGGSRTLTMDSSSTDGIGGSIDFGSNVNNRAGAYLAGLALKSSGSTFARDGSIGLGSYGYGFGVVSSILLKGDFSSTGKSSLNNSYGFTIDTEQGNSAAGGNITFAGADLAGYLYYGPATFNANTGLAGANGGNVSLATQNLSNVAPTLGAAVVDARGGSGGTAGDITLPALSTTTLYGATGTQAYYGRNITLNGNLASSEQAIGLTGDVRLARGVTIRTNTSGGGATGAVTLTGAGVSATTPGAALIIDTTTTSGARGAVSIAGGATAAGGSYLDSLNIRTNGNGGSAGAITLGSVATEGAQTYAGGTVSVRGGMSTNGGAIDLSAAAGLTITGASGSPFVIDTDRAGGNSAAGALRLGSNALGGNYALTIDTTADGGGANADLVLNGVGASPTFSSINVAAGNLTLAGITQAAGPITAEARGATADLTIASTGAVSSTGGGNIVLAAGRNFLNYKGVNAIPQGEGGQYFVYSTDPAGSLEGTTGYSKHYNQTYLAGSTPSYAGSGNWFLYRIAPVISVSPNATGIVYGNADPSTTLTAANYSGFIDGDTRGSLSGTQTLTVAAAGVRSGSNNRQVGTYAYTLNGTLTDSLGYQYAPLIADLAVTPRALALTGITASNKVYDGNTSSILVGTGTINVIPDDSVTLVNGGASGSFADKNAGSGKPVSVAGYTISGADAGNYALAQPTGLLADITPRALEIAGSSVTTKTYDGTTAAAVVPGTVSGLVGSETLNVGASGLFADKNAGADKNVNAAYVLGDGGAGGLGANYSLAGETLTGSIVAKAITVAATGVDKVYDGSIAATATYASAGVVEGDSVGFGGTANFADKNAGVGKAVSVSGIASSGADAGNYSLDNTSASTTASIATKTITVAATGVDKVYDGSRTATATLASAGVVSGDDIGFGGIASFADKNAGVGKAVGVSEIGSSGADAGNYSLSSTSAETTATIATKAITVAATGVDKVYDGNTAATASYASAGVVEGDLVAFGGIASFADKNVGVGKAVSINEIGSSGADAGNYSLNNTTAETTATIATRAITVAATGVDKVYDGSTSATATYASAGVVEGDSIGFGGIASFADKNVGVGKAVSVSEIASSGADAGNYSLDNTTASTTASIATKAITVAATGVDKVYDGSRAATATYASDGVVEGDSIGFGGFASFADKNAGVAKAVSVNEIASSGADAGNYILNNTTAETIATIAAKAITVAATGVDKVYDGSRAATTTYASAGIVEGDSVGFGGIASFADKNVGVGKAVSINEIGSSGADAGNYSLSNTTAETTATIATRSITVAATGVDKVYDGSRAATATYASAGVVEGDLVGFGGIASFADKNVGVGKAVSVSEIGSSGTDAGNYSLSNTTAETIATIATRSITVAATGVDKVYDGSRAATATYASDGVVEGDSIGFGGFASFADKNAGVGKAVSVNEIASSGADAGNYILNNTTAETIATIATKAITVAATGVDKVYDGSRAATATYASAGIVEGDSVGFGGTASFADKNVGAGKVVSVNEIGSSGTDAGNYSLSNTTAETTATIATRSITVAATGVDKVYDGSRAATATYASAGVVEGDSIGFGGIASFADKNVGVGKAVSVSEIGSSGADAGNYSLNNSTAETAATIATKTITVAATGIDKVYDGSRAAAVTLASAGIVPEDNVSFGGSASFADKNAGVGKVVSVDEIGSSGVDAGNYSLGNTTAATTASIATKAITVAATGINKVYDGTTAATAALAGTGVVEGDMVSFGGTATLADKNVGAGKAVGVTGIAAGGIDGGNYIVNGTAATTADVTPKAITVAATGVDRVYDGSTAATALLASAGVVSGDTVAFGGTASFADKNAGVGKAVRVGGIGSSGVDAGNYSLDNTSAATIASIAAKPITVAATGVDKVYDGSTAATAVLAGNGVVPGDTVSFGGIATLADKNVGIGKAVGVTGIAASGADAGNYSVEGTAGTTANVTARTITVAATGVDKVYDGSVKATALLAGNGVVSGDTVDFGGTASFADKNVGFRKTIGVAGIAASGTDAGNYAVSNTSAATAADITPKGIDVAARGVDKVYDGSTTATATLASAGVVPGDTVDFGGTASFADKNAGPGKTIGVTGIAASGTDANNYALRTTTAAASADIAPRSITVTASGLDKVYDGSIATNSTLVGSSLVPGDVVTFAGSANFVDRDAGIGKTVGVTNIAARGADAGNYRFSDSFTTVGTVTPKQLGVALVGEVQRSSEGSTDARLTSGNYLISGVVTGDSVSITKSSGILADATPSAAKRVSVDLAGTDYLAGSATLLSNYSLITGEIIGDVGLITGAPRPTGVPLSALVSLPNLPNGIKLSGLPSTDGTALIAGTDELVDAVEAIGTTPPDSTAQEAMQAATIVSANTKEKVSFRRTFTISDGGIRLPAGVKGSDKDASQ